MKIGVLTSSRADFGIYLPLLKKLRDENLFELNIIAFGTHLSPFHGETIQQIESEGFTVKYRVESMLLTDTAESIATAMGLTTIKFAGFWKEHSSDFDLVFCLGDRYEMFSAVTAGIAFNIVFAHLHGGETTLGAIDNIFRHGITLASKYHFVATKEYAKRVTSLIGENKNIYHVGALGLDNLTATDFLSIEEFKNIWNIDLSHKTILMTFHPETVNADQNDHYANELIHIIKNNPEYQFLITMPNADTAGNSIRKVFNSKLSEIDTVFLIENLGSKSYFSAMNNCAFLLGNTSSGIIEAASFGKYVIDLGDRQKGRASGENVIHVPIDAGLVQKAIDQLENKERFDGENLYYKNNSALEIIKILKQITPYA